MNCHRRNTIAAFSLVGACVLAPRTASAQGITSAEKQAIQKVLDAQVVAWNRGDLEGFLAGYWDSPALIYQSNRTVVHGIDGLRDLYHRSFSGPASLKSPMGQLKLVDENFVPL